MNIVTRKTNRASTSVMLGCGASLISLGLYFMILRPALLPEDARFMGTTVPELRVAAPLLERWLKNVFTVMGGFMASAGVLTVFVAAVAMPLRWKGTSWVIALSGGLSVGLICAMNFVIHSDFQWVLIVPAAAWLTGFVLYRLGH